MLRRPLRPSPSWRMRRRLYRRFVLLFLLLFLLLRGLLGLFAGGLRLEHADLPDADDERAVFRSDVLRSGVRGPGHGSGGSRRRQAGRPGLDQAGADLGAGRRRRADAPDTHPGPADPGSSRPLGRQAQGLNKGRNSRIPVRADVPQAGAGSLPPAPSKVAGCPPPGLLPGVSGGFPFCSSTPAAGSSRTHRPLLETSMSRREDLPRALDFHSRVPLHILRALAAVVSRYAHRSGLVSGATSARRWVPGPAEDPRVYSVMVQHPDSSDAVSLADPASLTDRASDPELRRRARADGMADQDPGRAGLPEARHLPDPRRLRPLGRHPRLQREEHDPRDPPAGPRRADPEADHHRRRLLEGRHPRHPPRAWPRATPT